MAFWEAVYIVWRRLRWRLFYVAVALFFGGALTIVFRNQLMELLLAPANGLLSPPAFGGKPVALAPTDSLFVVVDLMKRGAYLFAAPVATVSIFTLARPVIPRRFRWPLVVVVFSAYVLFAAGVVFTYVVMLETALGFLLGFGSEFTQPLVSITAYMELLWSLMVIMGVVFQLPLMMYLLSQFNIVPYSRLAQAHLPAIMAAPFFGALLTPGFDPFTAMLVAGPLLALYETGLFLAWLARPDADNYLFARKCGRGIRWLLHRPAAVFGWLVSLPSRIWRRLRRS